MHSTALRTNQNRVYNVATRVHLGFLVLRLNIYIFMEEKQLSDMRTD